MKKTLQLILLILFFAGQVTAQDYRWRSVDVQAVDTITSYTIPYAALSPDSNIYFVLNNGIENALYNYNNGNTK